MKKKEEEKKGKGEGSERKKERGRRQWEGGERGAKDGRGGSMIQGEHGKVELSLLSACWVLRFLRAFLSEVAVLFCESFRACNVFEQVREHLWVR